MAEGAELSDGRCILHWILSIGSIGIYGSIDELLDVHGHEGRTKVEWLDDVADAA